MKSDSAILRGLTSHWFSPCALCTILLVHSFFSYSFLNSSLWSLARTVVLPNSVLPAVVVSTDSAEPIQRIVVPDVSALVTSSLAAMQITHVQTALVAHLSDFVALVRTVSLESPSFPASNSRRLIRCLTKDCSPKNCVNGCDAKAYCDPGGYGDAYVNVTECPLNVCCSQWGYVTPDFPSIPQTERDQILRHHRRVLWYQDR